MPQAYAQEVYLPLPGVLVPLSPSFHPAVLKGIKLDPADPLRFRFFVDGGNSGLKGDALKAESATLVKYFLASLTIPEADLWVNLSPYEKDRIAPDEFGQTTMGRDLLAQDYLLKQVTASLIYPESESGRKFWEKVYKEAKAKYGTTSVPVNTFNKVWIVPDRAVVYESGGAAFVLENHLKVMLEEDYLSLKQNKKTGGEGVNTLGSRVVREVVIPILTREINEGRNFSQLRQVFYSLILATWYKKKIKNSVLNRVYSDRKKINGIDVPGQDERKIYRQYLEAFKKGVYNYVKETHDPVTGQTVPRKYFSGGVNAQMIDSAMVSGLPGPAGSIGDKVVEVVVELALQRSQQEPRLTELRSLNHEVMNLAQKAPAAYSLLAKLTGVQRSELQGFYDVEKISRGLGARNREFHAEDEGNPHKNQPDVLEYEIYLRRIKDVLLLLQGVFDGNLKEILKRYPIDPQANGMGDIRTYQKALVHAISLLEELRFDPRELKKEKLNVFKTVKNTVGYAGNHTAVSIIVDDTSDKTTETLLDPHKLGLVIINLVKNAQEAIDQDPLRKGMEKKGTITVKVERGDNVVKIIVSDNGPGIKPEYLGPIFERGFTTKAANGGSGIGLDVAKDIIEAHGGKILAASSLGQGSTFVIGLPIVDQAQIAPGGIDLDPRGMGMQVRAGGGQFQFDGRQDIDPENIAGAQFFIRQVTAVPNLSSILGP